MLKVENRIGIIDSKTSGLDTLELCMDPAHFKSYNKEINYRYSSMGYRDHEWPENLSNVVWCVGDSFTVGIGQPFEETWPQLLQKKINERCLNIGEDGCSNDTIALKTQEICKLYNPKNVVVMWSYFSRRRANNQNIPYDKKSFGVVNDLQNFHKNYEIVNALPTNIINLLIPNAFIDLNEWSKKSFENLLKGTKFFTDTQTQSILFFPQIDYARDRHHFDFNTSKYVCNIIGKHLTPPVEIAYSIDNPSKYPV